MEPLERPLRTSPANAIGPTPAELGRAGILQLRLNDSYTTASRRILGRTALVHTSSVAVTGDVKSASTLSSRRDQLCLRRWRESGVWRRGGRRTGRSPGTTNNVHSCWSSVQLYTFNTYLSPNCW